MLLRSIVVIFKKNSSVRDKETNLEVGEEDQTEHIDIDKFKCMRCKEIVHKKDALNEYDENGQNMCLCTILSYGEISGLVLP